MKELCFISIVKVTTLSPQPTVQLKADCLHFLQMADFLNILKMTDCLHILKMADCLHILQMADCLHILQMADCLQIVRTTDCLQFFLNTSDNFYFSQLEMACGKLLNIRVEVVPAPVC